MSLRRFFSANARDAMKLVRAELGDDAVILSNRAVDGGVEVIASADGDVQALINRASAPAHGGGPSAGVATARPAAAGARTAAPASGRTAAPAAARTAASTAPRTAPPTAARA